MPNTKNASVITTYIQNMLNNNKVALGVQDVWLGDQNNIPRTPALCVEPGTRIRDFRGSSSQFQNVFLVYILAYVGRIQDVQNNQQGVMTLAEAVENLLDTDPRLGNISADTSLVTFGRVTSIEPGFAIRQGAMLRAARITWEASSITMMGATA